MGWPTVLRWLLHEVLMRAWRRSASVPVAQRILPELDTVTLSEDLGQLRIVSVDFDDQPPGVTSRWQVGRVGQNFTPVLVSGTVVAPEIDVETADGWPSSTLQARVRTELGEALSPWSVSNSLAPPH